MHPTLEQVRETIESAIGGATDAELSAAPAAGRWSSAEILEHLSLSYGGTAYAMGLAIDKGKPIGKPATLWQRLGQLVVVGAGYFPKVEAPEPTRPRGLTPADARSAVTEKLKEMDAALSAAEERFGPRALVANHPVMGGLTVAGWRRFHLQHARHHARQIKGRIARDR